MTNDFDYDRTRLYLAITQPRSSKYRMAQSRRRLFIVMVRRDICPHPELVDNIAKLVCKVLPFSFVTPQHCRPRETVQEICHYNTKTLEDLGRPRTMPDMSTGQYMWEKSLRRNTSITEKFRQTRRSGLDLSLSGISLIQRVV